MREFKFFVPGGPEKLAVFRKMVNFMKSELEGTRFVHSADGVIVDVDFLRGSSMWRSIIRGLVQRATRDIRADLNPFECDWSEILFFDTETENAGKEWNMPPREFFRMGQYAWGDGEVQITYDYDEMIGLIRKAGGVVAHNAHAFDISTLFGRDSFEPLKMARDRKIIDTFVLAQQAFPAPDFFTRRNGRRCTTLGNISNVWVWLGLDNLAYQLGVEGKLTNLDDLAKEFNPPKTRVADLDYGLIPVDNPTFVEYGKQDVIALRQVFESLISIHAFSAYDWREQLKAAINNQVTRNGFAVDEAKARARAESLKQRAAELQAWLVQEYGMPTQGKKPWSSKEGKAAVMRALASFGVTPETRPDWKATKTGYSLGGDELKKVCEGAGEEAEQFAQTLAELKGQRSLSQLTLDELKEDGCVHPQITDIQRSGRSSTTNPGLTVWTARGMGAVEKSYLVPHPGCKLVSFDYSNADARIVAGYSQDEEYAKKFLPGVDGHELTGRVVWGNEEYDAAMPEGWETSDEIRHKNPYRQKAKALTHAWNYGGGAKTISRASGQPPEIAELFVQKMAEAYPKVVEWRNRCAEIGERGFIVNDWGRRMPVTVDRSYTQSSALMGQSGTREIITDALICMLEKKPVLLRWLVAMVHDELLFSIPEKHLDWAVPMIADIMSTEWKGVTFYASHGHPSDNWEEAGH